MDPRSSLNFDDSAVAGDGFSGLSSSIDNTSLFRSAPPLAASTVARHNRRRDQENLDSSGGSFLDCEHEHKAGNQLKLSFSAVDQPGVLPYDTDIKGSKSTGNLPQNEEESFASMVSWGGMPPYNGSKMNSRDSSLGIIPVDKMSDLSASLLMADEDGKISTKQTDSETSCVSGTDTASDSVFPGNKYTYTSLSQSLQKRTTPLPSDISDPSKHSAINWSANVETVKKRPSVPGKQAAPLLPGGVRQSLFGCKGEALVEGDEGDVTLPEVQFGEGELDQLDDDFGNFEATFNDSDIEQRESLPLPDKEDDEGTTLDAIYLSAGVSGPQDSNPQSHNRYPSLSKVNLFDEMGSIEDLHSDERPGDSRSVLNPLKAQSHTDSRSDATVEGVESSLKAVQPVFKGNKHLQKAEMYHSEGSEIDTEDELEMARRQGGEEMTTRTDGAGQSVDPLQMQQTGNEAYQKTGDQSISLAMRYSAEGDRVASPSDGGGCGGDGESDSDSNRDQKNNKTLEKRTSLQAKEFLDAFRDSFKGSINSPSTTLELEEERVRPMGDDLLTEEGDNRYSTHQTSLMPDTSGLQSQYWKPNAQLLESTLQPATGFEVSMFPPDDPLTQSQATRGKDITGDRSHLGMPGVDGGRDSPSHRDNPGDRLEASGFNINDLQSSDPFGNLQSSFGSFGASPPVSSVQDNGWTNLNASPLSHRASDKSIRSQLSPTRTSNSSVGSNFRIEGAGQSDERRSLPGQEQEEIEKPDSEMTTAKDALLAEDKPLTNASVAPSSGPPASQTDVFKEPRLSLYKSQFKSKDQDSSRLSKSMPVKQDSAGSPVYQKDLGKHKKTKKEEPKPQETEKKEVVYRDSTSGEYVTDLAFHTSFANMVASQQEMLQEQFQDGALGFNPQHNDEAFKTFSDAKAMLDADEEEFEKENVFREDANITAAVITPDSSWMVNKTSMACPLDSDELVRISIGTFMKSRSGALGSLGGDGADDRPEFGMKIKTPPENRKPYPLLENKEDRLSNIEEGETSQRTSGVGDDDEGLSPAANKTVTLSDLSDTPKADADGKTLEISDAKEENEVFTPGRNDTLNISEITRAIVQMPPGTCPKDMAKLVMSLSQNKRLAAASTTGIATSTVLKPNPQTVSSPNLGSSAKPSRLPVKKGSDVMLKVKGSPSSSPNVSKTSDKSLESEKANNLLSSSLNTVETSRLAELRMVGEAASDMLEKSNPDGEESDRSISPISGSNNVSPVNIRTQKVEPVKPRQTMHSVDNTQELYVRSPRSSSTVGLTGHHIPDGTDYSIHADYPHAVKVGMSREDVDGTEDIQMADSRGFDVIANGARENVNQRGPPQKDRYIVPDGSANHRISQNGISNHNEYKNNRAAAYIVPDGTLGATRSSNQRLSAHRSERNRYDKYLGNESIPTNQFDNKVCNRDTLSQPQVSDEVPSYSPTGGNQQPSVAASAIEREQLDLHQEYEHSNDQLKVNATPRSPASSQRKVVKSPTEVVRHTNYHSDDQGRSHREKPHNPDDDRTLMPPPPVPSFQHHLTPKQTSDAPLLLTSQSLMKTDFAQHYLVRDNPRLVNPPSSEALLRSHQQYEESMITPDQNRHRKVISESKEFGNLENMTMWNHKPAYHSTPFDRDTSVMSQVFQPMPMENTTLTHSMTIGNDSSFNLPQEPQKDNIVHAGYGSKLSAIEAPGTLRFPKVCCIGISTRNVIPLTNPTSRWLECLVHINSLTIDGNPVNVETTNPFEMKPKVIIEKNSTENLEVIFIPKYPGVYVAQLQINSLLFSKKRDSDPAKIPTEVSIQAIAEKPNIEVMGLHGEDHPVMDFGQVKWGSCSQMTLHVKNHSLASIPLRLAITSHRVPWHCFAFDRGPQLQSNDISVISRSSRLQSPALGRTVMTMCIPGRGEEEDMQSCEREVKVWCRPPDKHIDSSLQNLKPDEMSAIIKIEVDTPTTTLRPLEVIELISLVGFSRLHISTHLDILRCEAPLGRKRNTSFTLKNVGNINLHVKFDFVEKDHIFSVSPEGLTIPPNEESVANVSFHPSETKSKHFETMLLMVIEPDGPVYELPIVGKVIEEQRELSISEILLSDRSFVAFGGIAIGKSIEKKVTVLNRSHIELKLKVEVRSSTADFKIRNSSIHSNGVAESRDIFIKPQEKYPLYIRFSPSEISEQTAKLVLKPYNHKHKYSIPLTGYGGVSRLMLEGVSLGDHDCCMLDLGEIKLGEEVGKKLVLRNVGARAAFVKIKAFSDASCRSTSQNNRIFIEPNDFVLEQGEAKSVILLLHPSDREMAMCACGPGLVSTVMFYYGDEIMRQRFRRAHQQHPKITLPKEIDSTLASLRFNQPFMGEEHVFEAQAPVGLTPQHHIDKFYHSLSRLILSLKASSSGYFATKTPQVHSIGSSQRSSNVRVPSNWRSATNEISSQRVSTSSEGSALGVEPVRDTETRSNAKLMNMAQSLPPSLYNEGMSQEWIIKPDQLMLHVSVKDPDHIQIQKFQIINLIDKKLRYSLSWPGQLLQLTPEGGMIDPKSSTTICISASAWVYQNTSQLPCKANVTVDCGDICKVLGVQLRTDIPYNGTVDIPQRSHDPLATPTTVALSLQLPICLSPGNMKQHYARELKFPITKVGQLSETSIELSNSTDDPVRWLVTSFASPYVKGADGSNDVIRTRYKVFDFTEKFGCLTARSSVQLKVHFIPRSNGTFTQAWDIESKKGSKAARIQLTGEAVSNEVVEPKLSKTAPTVALYSTDKGEVTEPLIKVDVEGVVKFTPCAPGQAQILKINIKNKSPDRQTLEIISPQPPFHVKHLAVSIKRASYLRYPIDFRPVEPGLYQGLLIIKFGQGQSIDVRLEGLCQK